MASGNSAERLKAIMSSPSYLPVEFDAQFLQQPELRPVRVQLELLKPELAFFQEGVKSTVVVFGGTQVVETSEAQRELERAQTALANEPHERAAAARCATTRADRGQGTLLRRGASSRDSCRRTASSTGGVTTSS